MPALIVADSTLYYRNIVRRVFGSLRFNKQEKRVAVLITADFRSVQHPHSDLRSVFKLS